MSPEDRQPAGTNAAIRRGPRDPLAAILLLALAAGLFLRLNIGLADNGDYTRAMGWITSGPATMQENWPAKGSEEWDRRFRRYWIPLWKLDWPGAPGTVLTSTALLWVPGAALDWVFYSRQVLSLPVMSLVPRLAVLLLAVVALRWVARCGGGPTLSTVVKLLVGVPLVLILMATDYVRFFNTFYRETGTLVFLPWFLVGLVALARGRCSGGTYVACGAALVLLATAKITNVYWPFVALPLLLLAPRAPRRAARAVAVFAVSAGVAAAVFPFAELKSLREGDAFLSLYTGVLTFSDHPGEHLARLGLEDTAGMLGQSIFTPGPTSWLNSHPGALSHAAALNVLLHEPVVGLRAMRAAARAMQRIAPHPRLGQRAEGDATPPTRWLPQEWWGRLKAAAFPRGDALFLALAVLAAAFVAGLGEGGFVRELALVGLTVTVACPVEMAVQVFGAGTNDLVRHLLIANFLFDLAVVAFLGVATFAVAGLLAGGGARGREAEAGGRPPEGSEGPGPAAR